ncbi:hypothetical protein RCO27_14915 [Sphingosinicella sp. LHD-64]|uniref:hypothetical protein n=1 Tax=Sphingosinicella sp. LHD-64 TaxID=3072139 RepID=UPI00280EC1FA|nr:hypothetical protein [Sphingosinicella sp. LHD-64]MDQ8757520.1 hypothetical protein [Sphingosinicella sp. LHD-64]
MRKFLAVLAGTLVLTALPAQAAPRDPEAELARAVQGRVAGEPVDCIDLNRVRSSRIIDDTAIVYDAGSVVYVNRPRSGAESLDRWDTMVTRLWGSSRLCSIDTVRLVDTSSRMMTGVVFLGEFVPYRRVQTGAAN